MVNTLVGGSVAQPGVIAERWGVEASNCGSAIVGEEGSETSTLLFGMPLLISDVGRGLALRMNAVVRVLPLAIAMSDRLKASMFNSMVAREDYKMHLDLQAEGSGP